METRKKNRKTYVRKYLEDVLVRQRRDLSEPELFGFRRFGRVRRSPRRSLDRKRESQLAVGIRAPSENLSTIRQRQSVLRSHGDIDDVVRLQEGELKAGEKLVCLVWNILAELLRC